MISKILWRMGRLYIFFIFFCSGNTIKAHIEFIFLIDLEDTGS
jgi:hypothetical protein